MRLDVSGARARLAASDHGVLCTLHPERGIDAVPCVYATLAGSDAMLVGVPVDRVKAKGPGPPQRERNLAADPRATLLIEQWNRDDWSQLWWVRAELRHVPDPGEREAVLAALLAERFDQYRDQPFDRVLVLQVVGLTGWAA